MPPNRAMSPAPASDITVKTKNIVRVIQTPRTSTRADHLAGMWSWTGSPLFRRFPKRLIFESVFVRGRITRFARDRILIDRLVYPDDILQKPVNCDGCSPTGAIAPRDHF